MKMQRLGVLSGAIGIALLSGCATVDSPEMEQLKTQLTEVKGTNAELTSTVRGLESQLADTMAKASTKDEQLSDYEKQLKMAREGGASLLPPNARAGECYARVYIPPKFEKIRKTLPHTEASERIMTTPARYDWAEKQVLVREASTQLKVIPARYEWAEERVLVREASEKIIPVPAVYKEVREDVLIRPAYTTWKKGRGPIERIDEATGEIMCLVEVPAEYKTVVKHVVATPATTRTIAVPAEYKTVKRRVLAEGPKTVEETIPAQYKTVKVRTVAEPAKETRLAVPADSQEVFETRMVSEGSLEWRTILCETNTTPGVISRLQKALRAEGYSPGAIDGVLGAETVTAVSKYQKANGLASGKLTIETLKKLRVM